MPCYDKKLEASRSDFYSEIHATREVDCVLTTGELDLLLQDLGFDPYFPTPVNSGSESPWPDLLMPQGTSSGSYLHTILSHIAAQHPRSTATHIRPIRDSTDNEEYILYDPQTNEVLFKGAKVYGFRNLQNLVRRVGKETGLGRGKGAGKLGAAVAARRKKKAVGGPDSQGTSGSGTPVIPNEEELGTGLDRLKKWEEKKLDYVEVMACPSGCVNGGGQMKPVNPTSGSAVLESKGMEVDAEGYPRPLPDPGSASEGFDSPAPKLGKSDGQEGEEGWRWSTKEWVRRVEEIYWSGSVEVGKGGLMTPPHSPGQAGIVSADLKEDGRGNYEADRLAEKVYEDIERELGEDGKWEFLRTRFRKVEGDILGGEGGVTLEAVKW